MNLCFVNQKYTVLLDDNFGDFAHSILLHVQEVDTCTQSTHVNVEGVVTLGNTGMGLWSKPAVR